MKRRWPSIVPVFFIATLIFSVFDRVVAQEVDQELSEEELGEAVDESYDGDRTLLDIFGAATKQFLTQEVIPETDAECKWDWGFVGCEPICECEFRPQKFDYHLGRSCRLKLTEEDCDEAQERHPKPLQLIIQKSIRKSRDIWRTAKSEASEKYKIVQHVWRKVTVKASERYRSLQDTVCTNIPEYNCTGEMPPLAWQERLVCREMLPKCPQD